MQYVFMKKTKIILLLTVVLLLGTLTGCEGLLPFGMPALPMDDGRTKAAEIPVREDEGGAAPFLVRVLDVGQGLAVLVRADGGNALFDAGSRISGAGVVRALKKDGIRTLDFVSASHYDDDHAGGVPGVLHGIECRKLLLPDYTARGATYTSCLEAAEDTDTEIVYPKVGDSFLLGGASVQVIGPERFDMEEENDRCLAYRIDYGDCHVLVCGDAEEREESFISRSLQPGGHVIYVVDHHGSYTSSTEAFLSAAGPEAAILSCGTFNEFAHPHRQALERIRRSGAALYRTDLQGTVTVCSDGNGIWTELTPCQDFSEGKYPEEAPEEENKPEEDVITGETIDPSEASFVCNRGSFVFHYPDCENVPKIHSWNLGYTSAEREKVLEYGYKACRNCRP